MRWRRPGYWAGVPLQEIGSARNSPSSRPPSNHSPRKRLVSPLALNRDSPQLAARQAAAVPAQPNRLLCGTTNNAVRDFPSLGRLFAAPTRSQATTASRTNGLSPGIESRISTFPVDKKSLYINVLSAGGEGGIRTLGTLAGTTVFETAPIDHSGTSPARWPNLAVRPGHGRPGP